MDFGLWLKQINLNLKEEFKGDGDSNVYAIVNIDSKGTMTFVDNFEEFFETKFKELIQGVKK